MSVKVDGLRVGVLKVKMPGFNIDVKRAAQSRFVSECDVC